MRSAAKLKKQKDDALMVAVIEAKEQKINAEKYKNELSKVKKELKNKDNELVKSNKSFEKAKKDPEASKAQVTDLQAELLKYKDLEAQARVARDQPLQEKQALVDGCAAESEKLFEDGYNTAIIFATVKMKKIKHVIYQAGFEFGLETTQVPISHELHKLKVACPNSIFHVRIETEDEIEVLASIDNVVEHTKD